MNTFKFGEEGASLGNVQEEVETALRQGEGLV